MLQRIRRVVLVALLLTSAACGSDNPTGPNGSDSPMTAVVDGNAWAAFQASAVRGGGQITINAASEDFTAIGFAVPDDVATHTFAPGVLAAAGWNDGTEAWIASGVQGSGSITITALEADRVEGTFSFVLVDAIGGALPDVTITNGRFNIDF